MKKYLGLLAVLVLALFVGASVAGAETSATDRNAGWNLKENVKRESPTKQSQKGEDARVEFKAEFKGEFGERREAFREKMDAARKDFHERLKTERDTFLAELKVKREEWRTANSEKKMAFWNNAKRMIGVRFEVAIKMLESIQGRVAVVIDGLEADGKDTSAAVEFLDSSKDNLAAAKVKVEEIKNLIPDNGEKITPEIFEKIKLLAREAKDLLKESKEDLRSAIKEIKELRGESENDENDDGDND